MLFLIYYAFNIICYTFFSSFVLWKNLISLCNILCIQYHLLYIFFFSCTILQFFCYYAVIACIKIIYFSSDQAFSLLNSIQYIWPCIVKPKVDLSSQKSPSYIFVKLKNIALCLRTLIFSQCSANTLVLCQLRESILPKFENQ